MSFYPHGGQGMVTGYYGGDLAGHPCTCSSRNAGWAETKGSHHSLAGFSLQEGSQRISLCGIGYGNAAPLQVLP